MRKKVFLFSWLLFLSNILSGQLNFEPEEKIEINKGYVSNTAYKLPYRGDNYKFYGTVSFHIYGRAFVNNKVYNTFTEAQHFCKYNIPEHQIRILKASAKKNGRFKKQDPKYGGNIVVFMTPMLKGKKPVKFYYRTGLLRFLYTFDENGFSKNKKLKIDFDATAKLILNIDDAAKIFGTKIKSVTIKKRFIKNLYKSKHGEELKKRKIRFKKYLSKKMNRKYEKLFLTEFE
ncbi:MAG: hypothetical protein GXO50_01240 [Chlorobi bacterium]|nr:hypothetical protein [Chlorobiota bacterium]